MIWDTHLSTHLYTRAKLCNDVVHKPFPIIHKRGLGTRLTLPFALCTLHVYCSIFFSSCNLFTLGLSLQGFGEVATPPPPPPPTHTHTHTHLPLHSRLLCFHSQSVCSINSQTILYVGMPVEAGKEQNQHKSITGLEFN